MQAAADLGDLIAHLAQLTGMQPADAGRVVEEVIAYFSESLEEFVSRRHRELQGDHMRNEAIFEQLQEEVQRRRFAAPPLSARQLRRLVYG